MSGLRKHLPNILTCCNLLCGSIGVVFIMENRGIPAAYFVWAAGLFDFFDGFVARAVKTTSLIGRELDSLADMVSFGLLPAIVMYKMIGDSTTDTTLPFVAFMIAVFSALRLAIFNVDETQRDSFRGLNTPANTIFITSLPFVINSVPWLQHTAVLVAITVIFSLMLVSPLTFFAFKFKNFTWADNKIRFTFLVLSVLLLALLQLAAIPLIILLYIGLSLGVRLVSK